jgi:hypothetical protein
MNVARVLLLILGVLAVVYQFFVSVMVVRSTVPSRGQKTVQVILIWLVPVLGAFIAHWVIRSTEDKASIRDRNFIPEEHSHW